MSRISDWISRWLMRSMEAGRVLQIPLLGVTAVSTLTTALKGTFLQPYTIHIIAGFGLCALGFIYQYDNSGVLNKQNREKMDRSDNFAGPGMAMGMTLQGRQRAVMAAAAGEEWSLEETLETMDDVTVQHLQQYRDGIDVRSVFNEGDLPNGIEQKTNGSDPRQKQEAKA